MDTGTSVIYGLLPQLIRRRVHSIPSLRRSMSWNAKTTAIYDPLEPPSTPTRPSTSDSDASCTPPPSYRTSRVFGGYDVSTGFSTPDVRPSRPVSASYPAPVYGQPDQTCGGIDWKYADQGMKLLDHSLQETWSAAATNTSSAFPRQLYLHACTYLMRALPSDLTTEEAIGIENALPQAVRDNLAARHHHQPCEHDLLSRQGGRTSSRSDVGYATQQTQRHSMLHQAVAFLVLRFFLVVNVLLPYLKLLLGQLYRFERKHRVSERVFSAGVQGVDMMGKRGVELSRRIASVNDGKVGHCMNELMVWWIRGVTGGIHEGVGEGLSLVGAAATANVPRQQIIARDVQEVR